jgi:hypothetical protein
VRERRLSRKDERLSRSVIRRLATSRYQAARRRQTRPPHTASAGVLDRLEEEPAVARLGQRPRRDDASSTNAQAASASTKMTERILIALTVLLALGIPVGTYVVLRLLGF